MKREIEERTCDNCNKTTQRDNKSFGMTPFGPWISMQMNVCHMMATITRTKDLDFCCTDCAIEYLQSTKDTI